MTWQIVLTLSVLLLATVVLVWELLPADAILLTALAVVTVAGVIDLEQALQGFANPTLLAIGSLYVIAEGLRRTGVLERAGHHLIGEASKGLKRVLARLTSAVAIASAFLNNTPIVAMAVPAVRSWSHRHGVSTARLLMPVSFASIFGGLCTLVGTSTNLVTDGLLRSHGLPGLGFFELAWVGLPCALVGIAYLVLVSPRVLEAREDVREAEEKQRESMLELEVLDRSPLIGKTPEEAGLIRPGIVLARIARGASEIGTEEESRKEPLRRGDRLVFAGKRGEQPAIDADELARLRATATPHRMDGEETHEAVIKEGSKLIGSTVDEADFPRHFNARVTGVRRGGHRFEEPTGNVRLKPGDILMLDTGPGFREAYERSPDLFVASEEEDAQEEPIETAPAEESRPSAMVVSILILLAVVGLAATGILHIAMAGLLGAVALLSLRIISAGEAREAVDWSVLIVIGAALGLASALELSGAAELIASGILGVAAGFGPIGILSGLLLATMLLTGLITNNAAAALIFPIALSVAEAQGLEARPMLIGITIAASLSLWTPLGYQTNLMVYGPGNYRFTDFTRLGLPLQLILAAVAVAVIPLAWSF